MFVVMVVCFFVGCVVFCWLLDLGWFWIVLLFMLFGCAFSCFWCVAFDCVVWVEVLLFWCIVLWFSWFARELLVVCWCCGSCCCLKVAGCG